MPSEKIEFIYKGKEKKHDYVFSFPCSWFLSLDFTYYDGTDNDRST